jgi:hypothetical protein
MPGGVGEAKLDLWRTTDLCFGPENVDLRIDFCYVPFLGGKCYWTRQGLVCRGHGTGSNLAVELMADMDFGQPLCRLEAHLRTAEIGADHVSGSCCLLVAQGLRGKLRIGRLIRYQRG